ncbi:hypothetical protein Hanom_Chr03g00270211 [Helianthus anomalus]
MESARCAPPGPPPQQPKVPSPSPSANSKGEQVPPQNEDDTMMPLGPVENNPTHVVQ